MLLLRSFLLIALLSLSARGHTLSEEILFKRLDPLSITEQLSFYHLYQESNYGKQALTRAWELLHNKASPAASTSSSAGGVSSVVEPLLASSGGRNVSRRERRFSCIDSCIDCLLSKQGRVACGAISLSLSCLVVGWSARTIYDILWDHYG